MASSTQWTWVWVNSSSCCWTGRPGVLQFMGSQRVRNNWATELNWSGLPQCSLVKNLSAAQEMGAGNSKEIQPVHSKGDQPWVFFGRNDVEAETPILWPPHAKSWLIGKDSDAGRDWGQEEKGTTEDEMAGWHHWLNGHESEWTLGVGDGQGGLACCDSWGLKESDTTEWLNWTDPWTTWVWTVLVPLKHGLFSIVNIKIL